MASEPKIVIRCASDLWQALRWSGEVALRLPFLDEQRQASTEIRFNFWRNVCGCQVSALALLVTLGCRIPAILQAPEWTLITLATETGIVLLAAFAGKLLAIFGARFLLAVDIVLLLRHARQSLPNAGRS